MYGNIFVNLTKQLFYEVFLDILNGILTTIDIVKRNEGEVDAINCFVYHSRRSFRADLHVTGSEKTQHQT